MDRGRVGEERGGKEIDKCPLTPSTNSKNCYSLTMDVNKLQEMKRQLSKQVKATCITTKNLAKLFLMLTSRETKNIDPTSLTPNPIILSVNTIPSASQVSQIKPGTPNNFNRDRLKG
jgi:hypothetical protein